MDTHRLAAAHFSSASKYQTVAAARMGARFLTTELWIIDPGARTQEGQAETRHRHQQEDGQAGRTWWEALHAAPDPPETKPAAHQEGLLRPSPDLTPALDNLSI